MFFSLIILSCFTLLVRFCNCLEAVPSSEILRRKFAGRVFGGSSTNIANYPSIVAVLANGDHVCGGTIIGWTTVLTAAHCFRRDIPVKYTLRANSTYAYRGGTIYGIKKVIIHEKFENVYLSHDFAVAITRRAFKYYQIAPFAKTSIPAGSTVQIAGWGQGEDNKDMDDLQHGNLIVLGENLCKRWLKEYSIEKSMFCATSPGGNVDTCAGDSGGPLYYGKMVTGVTSWGVSCGGEYPGVYGNVSYISSWLNQFIKKKKNF